jgi:hypothetical protein
MARPNAAEPLPIAAFSFGHKCYLFAWPLTIIRGIEKRRIIDDKVDQENFVSRMGGIAASTGTSIFAWALLTNHCHLLLRSSEFGISSYRQFICDGVSQGNRPELVGAGLVRSQGGWGEVKALRRIGQNEAGDERIIGSGDFVETITNEANSMTRRQFTGENQKRKIQ